MQALGLTASRKAPLRVKLLLAFLGLQAFLLVLVACSVFLLKNQTQLSKNNQDAVEAITRLTRLHRILTLDLNTLMQVGMFGKSEALPYIKEANIKLRNEMVTLTGMSKLPKDAKESLIELDRLLINVPDLMDQISKAVDRGDEERIYALAREMDAILQKVPYYLEATSYSVLEQSQNAAQKSFNVSQRVFVTVLAALAGAIIFTLAMGIKTLRELIHPLEDMHAATERISREDYSHPLVTEGHTFLEIEELAVSLNKLQDTVRASHQQLEYRAMHDSLTGLANRALFLDRLRQAMSRARRNQDSRYAVIFLDLDRFKVVNDTYGHQGGDDLLQAAGRRLAKLLRETDTLARLGGDEFTILLEGNQSPEDVSRVARRILFSLSEPFNISGLDLRTTASLGVVLGEKEFVDAQQVLRYADIALYQAKNQGKNRVEFYNPDLHQRVSLSHELEIKLREALERRELEPYYQPIVDLTTRKVEGFEVLIRWKKDGSMVLPSDFIPLAEETGLILPIGWWIMKEALSHLNTFRKASSGGSPLWVSVNLSSRQLLDREFRSRAEEVLGDSGIPQGGLRIEITESGVMKDISLARERLELLQNMGAWIYLDDFGTGYSSLAHLHQLPVDGLKIDMSFTQRLTEAQEAQSLVASILNLARTLEVDIVAEGIETEEQRECLLQMGCKKGQGFLFSRPVPIDGVLQLLSTAASA